MLVTTAVVRLLSSWGFSYVENLSWVLLQPNHAILRLPYPCLQRSHITLYIFRRDGAPPWLALAVCYPA